MRNYLKAIAGGALAVLLVIGALSTSLFALTAPPSFSPRVFPTQQTHYLRFTVNFNSCALAAGTCSVKVGALPYNAFLISATQQVTTAFNSGTTDTVALGTASGGAQLVAAQSVHAAGDATALTLVHPGIASVGNGIAQSGANGGFDVWAVYAQTGAAPTAGQAVYLIQYAAPNDGSCAPVPLGATAPAC